MHQIQEKILELAETQDVLSLGIRPLGRLIGVDRPQIVKHHLIQLQKLGLLKPKSREDIQQFLQHSSTLQPSFVQIPVVGAANCGPATFFADEHIEKYLTISHSLLKKRGNIFALVAKGNSMNNARVNGNAPIEDKDYVLIDGDQRTPSSGDYVLSIIDDAANIKKYTRTEDGNIALVSESTEKFAPIYISEDDRFMVNGKVIQVIKGARNA
ncbi:MAG: hypothetical protein M3Q44_07840 [bacterium]|nr:hypothetical protein [bacterium]